MTSYTFDEEGVAFYFFVLTLVGIYVIPSTIRLLWPKKTSKNDLEPTTSAVESEDKRRRLAQLAAAARSKQYPKWAFLGLMWGVFAWALYAASQAQFNNKIYDPFEVLGVSSGATEADIKNAFKRLSRVHHPDKAPEDKREEAEKMFVEIGKAYKTLTDEKIRKNWEEYGNPDGIRTFALGVALPAWMVSSGNKYIMVMLYLAAFGLAIPLLVAQWWKHSKSYSKSGVRHESMRLFFEELKESSGLKKILELLANAIEFHDDLKEGGEAESKAMAKLVSTLQSYDDPNDFDFEFPRKVEKPSARKAYALLYCHFHRITVEDPKLVKDQAFIVATSQKIIQGILQISLSREWLHPTLHAVSLSAYLTQAQWEGQSALLQLPHITPEVVKHFTSGKKNIRTIEQFLAMSDEDRRSILRSLSPNQYEETLGIAQSFPQVHISAVSFKILGQDKITPGGVITCQIRLNLEYPCNAATVDHGSAITESSAAKTSELEDEVETFEFDEDGNLIEDANKKLTKPHDLPPPVYCPRFPALKRPVWWVSLVNKNNTNFVTVPVKVTDLVDKKTVTLQLPSPPRAMPVSLMVVVRCDSIIGADVTKEVSFTVYPASEVASPSGSEEWDISGDEGNDGPSFGAGGGHHCANC